MFPMAETLLVLQTKISFPFAIDFGSNLYFLTMWVKLPTQKSLEYVLIELINLC